MAKNQRNEQSKRFIEAAKSVEADSGDGAFDRVLKRVAKAPPPDTVQERKSPKSKKSDK